MSSGLSFLSQELKIGDPPSLAWERFKKPQLRRFPPTSFKYLEYLGDGVDGQVVKVEAAGHPEPLVLKFVSLCYAVSYCYLPSAIVTIRDPS